MLTDCVIKDDNGGFDGKGSVRVSNEATAKLVRTKILNSGRCAYRAHFELEDGFQNNNDCCGGLSLGDCSTTYLKNVEISGCVPSGIVVCTRLTKVVLCGPVLFRNNAKGIAVEDGPSSNVRFAIDTLMDTLDYAPKEIRSELEAAFYQTLLGSARILTYSRVKHHSAHSTEIQKKKRQTNHWQRRT